MFSAHLQEYAQKKYEDRLNYYHGIQDDLDEGFKNCTEEEAILMRFLYGTMPVRDAGEYEFRIFLDYVKHALWLRKHVPWCAELPEDMFLHYVLYYRINSEDISECRGFFYEQLKDRIEGMTMEEAVLEINYWCAEHVVYEATDSRTASPMTMYRCGKGRCGEESTFTVSAYRSMGIPARQVYAPRWAHCDDNHAWAEVYLDGQWHYIGACEPEERPDRGWFAGPASRAILIHCRTFSDYVSNSDEKCIGREEGVFFYNTTPSYAEVKTLTVTVLDKDNRPAEGAFITLQILNMAEFSIAARLITDKFGQVQITMGLGDVLIRAVKDGWFAEKIINPGNCEQEELVLADSLDDRVWIKDKWTKISLEAPAEDPARIHGETEEEKQRRTLRTEEANQLRERRLDSFYEAEIVQRYPREAQMFRTAGGNAGEIAAFLGRDDNPDRGRLLHQLVLKDYKDLKADILESHLDWNHGVQEYPGEMAEKYLLNPRVYLEELTPYRSFILDFFSADEKELFAKDPEALWCYIRREITWDPEADYKTICATPVGCLKMKQGNPNAQKILFVAVLRTLGVPARYNQITGAPEYYDGTEFRVPVGAGDVKFGKKATLTLTSEDGDKWNYFQNWSLGLLKETDFVSLDYEGIRYNDNSLTLELEAGVYRMITSLRRPDGGQQVCVRCFTLKEGEHRQLESVLWESDMDDMLVKAQLQDFHVMTDENKASALSEICGGQPVLLAFLGVGAEPTEHVLNELLDAKEMWNRSGARLLLILRSTNELENATLKKVLESLDNLEIYFDPNKEDAAQVALRLEADPEKLPVFAVLDKNMAGLYGLSGYHVGSVDLMMRIWKQTEK